MNQLKGLDAGFLYAETTRMPMHIGSVQMFEQPADRRGDFFADLKRMVRSRSHLLPYMTHRIEHAPLQIDHPSWVACEPDYDAHIERIELSPPGDVPQLERIVASLHARPLERSRPLWKIYYIDGLDGGRVAYFNVVHHACLDGLAGQAAVDVLTDAAPTIANGPAPMPANASHRARSLFERLLDRGTESIADAARGIDAFVRLGRHLVARPPGDSALLAPATPINRTIGAERRYAVLRVSLADVKAIGKAHGCSVNDVFLTMCGGALRAYLLRAGLLPDMSLLAGVPVSVRRPDDRTMNTQVTMMRVALGTQIADPVARMLAIHAFAVDAKELAQYLSALMPANPRLLGAPWLGRAAAQLWELSDAANHVPPLINVVISNVPGPKTIRYSNGARMLTHFPVSIPAHGTGMNITVQSYAEHFDIGITACAATMPDLGLFRDDLLRAYIDLRARVLNRTFDVRTLHPAPPRAIERRCLQRELLVA
jgi:diacylglycerol O-acyltransferase / wax synthase